MFYINTFFFVDFLDIMDDHDSLSKNVRVAWRNRGALVMELVASSSPDSVGYIHIHIRTM